MKNILVPIDFSETSFNAVSYAAFLANAFKTHLTLVHAYTDTSAFDESPKSRPYDSVKELEAAHEKFLKKEMERIARRFTVKINCIAMKGHPVEVINEVAQKVSPDMIIMGMKGKGESNSVLGSTTVSMIDETSIPLLIIPKSALYQTVDSITLTSDFKNEKLLSHFPILEKLIAKFNPFIQILNVQKETSKLTAEVIADKMREDLTWDKYNHSFNIMEKDDVEEGIFRFIRRHPTDLLVMVARKRDYINKMIEPSHTKKMTGQTKIPLLVLHENKV
jgi:nucleotide-binding universal stress UspA family protein